MVLEMAMTTSKTHTYSRVHSFRAFSAPHTAGTVTDTGASRCLVFPLACICSAFINSLVFFFENSGHDHCICVALSVS